MNAPDQADGTPGRGAAAASPEGGLAAAARFMSENRWNDAAAAYRWVIRRAPDRAEAWDGLGSAMHHAGRHAEAERVFRQAVKLRPDSANLRDHLGVALRALGRSQEAVEEYETALSLEPQRASTLNNLGNALVDIGQWEKAIEALSRSVSLAPDAAGFQLNLVRALLRASRCEEALEHLEKLRAAGGGPEIEAFCGNALMQLNRYEEAIVAYRRAMTAGLRDHFLLHNLATALQYFGKTEEAQDAYRAAIELRPDRVATRRQLTNIRQYDTADRDLDELRELLQDPNLPASERAEAHMSLGKIFDDLGRYPEAFSHLQAGNQLIRSAIDYSADQNTQFIDAVIRTFDRKFFAERAGFGIDTEVPLFILGMPRSGTSLVEQILSSHPEVHGAGELTKLYELFVGLRTRLKPDLGMPRIARLIDRSVADEMARQYLDYLRAFNPQARMVSDKMPFNYRVLGLIALLYPKARIIHCRRHPLDTGLSCYFMRFLDTLSFSFNLVDIGRYYQDYKRLMEHWRRVVTNPMLDVHYEALVTNPESEIRRLLEFCGLDWDDRCLKFYDTERAVVTASHWQVRQPIYTASLGRWRNYKDYIEPLIAALGTANETDPGDRGDSGPAASPELVNAE